MKCQWIVKRLPAIKVCAFIAGISLSVLSSYAVTGDNMADTDTLSKKLPESIFPEKSRSLALSHFSWGAEAGASIDLTGHDMSTFDVDVMLGYKNSYIKFLGLGAGIHRAIQSGNNFIPIYVSFQSSFRKRPSVCFLSLKLGYSFNTIGDSPTFGDFVSAVGCGINLSQSKLARTYILLSIGYRYFNNRHLDYIPTLINHYAYMAHLSFGVSF